MCAKDSTYIRGMLIAAEGRQCTHESCTDKRSSLHRTVSCQISRLKAPALSVGSYDSNQGSSPQSLRPISAVYCLAASKGEAVNPPKLKAQEQLPRLAVFVSGGGSNFRAIHAAILNCQIQAEVAVRSFGGIRLLYVNVLSWFVLIKSSWRLSPCCLSPVQRLCSTQASCPAAMEMPHLIL